MTVTNCLSIPGLGSNLVFATLGCITGVTKLISCGYLACGGSSCPVEGMEAGTPVSSSWTSSCESTHRSGRFAKLYSFTLDATASVTIDLSSSVDPYLYLLQGSGASGRILARDDDRGPGHDARISQTLGPGTYTIEATTYASGRAGSFTLSLSR